MNENEIKDVEILEGNQEEQNQGTQTETDNTQNQEERKYSQKELDEIIEKRLNRERRKFSKNQETKTEKQEEENDEIKTLKETIKKQNDRIIRNEAKAVATKIGIDVDFVDAVIALANFEDIELDNNGEIDTEDVEEVLKSVIDKYPKFLRKNEDTKKESENKGFVKVGVEQKESSNQNKILEQIRKNMGLN